MNKDIKRMTAWTCRHANIIARAPSVNITWRHAMRSIPAHTRGRLNMGNNAYKKRHKELGLCLHCSRPAEINGFCEVHFYKRRVSNVEFRHRNKAKLIESRRCLGCTRHLIDEMDDGANYCLSCRMRSGKNYITRVSPDF